MSQLVRTYIPRITHMYYHEATNKQ